MPAHTYICSTRCGQTGGLYHTHNLKGLMYHTPPQNQHKHNHIHLWIREEKKKKRKKWCIQRKITLTKPRWRGTCSPLLPEGLSSEILEMLIRVNQVRPSTEGTVAVLEAAPKHLSPLTVSTVRLLVIPPPPARRKTDSSTDFPFNCSIMPSCGFLTHEVGCYSPPQMRGLPCKDWDVEGKREREKEKEKVMSIYPCIRGKDGYGWWVSPPTII